MVEQGNTNDDILHEPSFDHSETVADRPSI